jgi:pimeloyl-ACP methyl ester carboxylesterase
MRRYHPTPLALGVFAALAVPLLADTPRPPGTTDLGHGPAFVIVHELGDSRLTWMPTARRLMGHHRVVLTDLPGHGDTPLPDPFSLEAAAAALDPLLATLPRDSTVLVGKGAGGLVAMLAAAAHPEVVRGVVLIDVALHAPMKVSDQQTRMFMQWMDDHYDEFLNMTLGHAGRDSTESVAIRARAGQVPAVTIKSYMRALLAADPTRTAAALKTPALLLLTGRTLEGGEVAVALKQLGWEGISIPVRTLPQSGYLVMQQQPDSVAAVLEAFEAGVLATR